MAIAAALLELLLIVASAAPASAQGGLPAWTFSCKIGPDGKAQTQQFFAPTTIAGSQLVVLAVGGGGSPGKARPNAPGGAAGAGGIVESRVPVQAEGQVFNITVGCGAGRRTGFSADAAPGGNGNGGSGATSSRNDTQGGGGGGATLVTTPGPYGFSLVAGGGGGGGAALFPEYSKPGAGGAGGNPPGNGGDGTNKRPTLGGRGGAAPGPDGQAGFVDPSGQIAASGGGGGGCRGGEGGARRQGLLPPSPLRAGAGGGGGSSCATGNYLTDSVMYLNGRNYGDGYVILAPYWSIGCNGGRPYRITIPSGPFNSVSVVAAGGGGFSGSGTAARGGRGGLINARFPAEPGSVIRITSGCAGAERGPGGAGFAPGGNATQYSGGGGGGASAAELIIDPQQRRWLAVAGGGGGGGGSGAFSYAPASRCGGDLRDAGFGGAGGTGGLHPARGASGNPGPPGGGRTPGGDGGSLPGMRGGDAREGRIMDCPGGAGAPIKAAGGGSGGGGGGCHGGAAGLAGGYGGSLPGAGGGGGGGGSSCAQNALGPVSYKDGYNSGNGSVKVTGILSPHARPDAIVDGVGENVENSTGSGQRSIRSTTGHPVEHSIVIENDGGGIAPFEVHVPQPPRGFAVEYMLSIPSGDHESIPAGRNDIIMLPGGQQAKLKMRVLIVGARAGARWRAHITVRRFDGPSRVDVVRAVTTVR